MSSLPIPGEPIRTPTSTLTLFPGPADVTAFADLTSSVTSGPLTDRPGRRDSLPTFRKKPLMSPTLGLGSTVTVTRTLPGEIPSSNVTVAPAGSPVNGAAWNVISPARADGPAA